MGEKKEKYIKMFGSFMEPFNCYLFFTEETWW